jgi:ferredoxin
VLLTATDPENHMGYKLVFDRSKCQGYANCLIEAPEIWDFDEDEDVAVLREELPAEELRTKAEASVRGCPASAITIADVSP